MTESIPHKIYIARPPEHLVIEVTRETIHQAALWMPCREVTLITGSDGTVWKVVYNFYEEDQSNIEHEFRWNPSEEDRRGRAESFFIVKDEKGHIAKIPKSELDRNYLEISQEATVV